MPAKALRKMNDTSRAGPCNNKPIQCHKIFHSMHTSEDLRPKFNTRATNSMGANATILSYDVAVVCMHQKRIAIAGIWPLVGGGAHPQTGVPKSINPLKFCLRGTTDFPTSNINI